MEFINLLSSFFLLLGSIFIITGAIGIIRMPDFFLRMHACSIIETLGVFFLSIGMILLSGSLNSLKIILLLLVIFFVSPTVSHIISQAAKHHSSPSGEQ